jgi:integrase/recombinase XerC
MAVLAVLPSTALQSSPAEALLRAFWSGKNPRTLAAYQQDWADFCAFMGIPDSREVAVRLISLSGGEANATASCYQSHLVERGLAAATINRRLAALRSLVKLARTLGLVNFTLEISSLKSCSYRDTRGPGSRGVSLLVQTAKSRVDAKGTRDTAILRLLYDLGLRRGEAVNLDLADFNVDAGTVSVIGKGRTERETLTLPKATRQALRAWLSVRGSEPGPLFTNFDRAGKGQRLTGRSVERIVKRLGQEAGVAARPHGLRHAAITEALDLTRGDVRAVQRFSRHRDLKTLTIYDDNRRDMGGEVAKLVANSIPTRP